MHDDSTPSFNEYIVHFRDPTPDNSSGLQWSPYSNNQSYLHFKQDDMTMEHNLWPERMQFWRSVPYPNRDDGDYRKKLAIIYFWVYL